jgi:hypothetical protein
VKGGIVGKAGFEMLDRRSNEWDTDYKFIKASIEEGK